MVARAARTGGGRRAGTGRTVQTFHLVLIAIVVVGIGLVWFSRYEAENGTVANSTPPTTKQTWLTGYSIDICGTRQPNLPTNANLYTAGTSVKTSAGKPVVSGTVELSLYTEGDGIIHIHPLARADAGDNATLGLFVKEYPGLTLDQTELRYPGGKLYTNGDKCGTKRGTVEVELWKNLLQSATGALVPGNPDNLKLDNDQLITIAFLPAGQTVPRPPESIVNSIFASPSTTTTVPTTTPPTGASTATTKPST